MNKNIRIIVTGFIFLLTSLLMQAQTTFYESFDGFNAEQNLVSQAVAAGNTTWRLWSGKTAEDAIISANYSMTPNNSLLIQSADDIVFYPGSYTTGRWFFSGHIYVPAGNTAYFNMMHNWADYNYQWACQVYFPTNGIGYLNVNNNNYTFSFTHGEWLYFSMEIDLTNDLASFWVNDVLVHTWPWHYTPTATTGSNKFEAVNFFGWNDGASKALFYADEITISSNAIIRFENKTSTWDGTAKQVTVRTYPPNLPCTITYNGSTSLPVEPGAYTVIATITNPLYPGSATGTMTINKAAATASISNTDQVYNGVGKSVSVTTVPAGLATTITYNGSSVLPINVGTYTVVATINDAHYQGSVTGTLTITKAPASIAVSNKNVVYNGTAKPVTITTTPVGISNSVTYNGSTTVPVTTGKYVVKAVITNANYSGQATDTLVISKATATVTLSNINVTYNGSAQPVTVTTVPAGLTTIVTYNGSATAPTNAGSYTVSAIINNANYQGNVTGTLLINKAIATITVNSTNTVYNGSPRPVTVIAIPAGLATIVTYDGSATAPTNVGTYAVSVTVNNSNYQGTSSVSLTIDKAIATVTITGTNHIYNGSAKNVTIQTNPIGLITDVTYDGSTTTPVNAGSYAVIATINSQNYHGQSTGTLVISKATTTVTVSNTSQIYNGTEKPVTVSTNPSGLSTTVTYNGSSTVPVNAGSYSIFASVADANYEGNASSLLTVEKASASIMVSGLTKVYNGSALVPSVGTLPEGLALAVTYNGLPSEPVNVGTYATNIVIDDANYQGSANTTFNISKASAEILISDTEAIYDGSGKSVNVVTIPSGLAVDITYNGSSEIPVNAGTYIVNAVVNDINYERSVNDTFIISKANATIILSDIEPVYDGNQKPVTVETTPSGLPFEISYNGSSEIPVNAGSYTVEVFISDSNYQGSVAETMNISKAEGNIILSSPFSSGVYDGIEHGISVQTKPEGLICSVTYNGLEELPVNAGTYFVTAVIENENYSGQALDTIIILQDTAEIFVSELVTTFDGSEKSPVVTTNPANLTTRILFNGSETRPVNAGTYIIEASINDINYIGIDTDTLVIQKETQTIAWEQNLNVFAPGANTELNAVASSNLEVYYTSSNPAVATVSGSNLIINGVGQATIFAHQDGNENYLSASVSKDMVVNTNAIKDLNLTTINCWPNPAIDYINIGIDTELMEVELYNQAGSLISKQQIEGLNPQIDLSGLASGIYILKMNYNNSNYIIKVSKQ